MSIGLASFGSVSFLGGGCLILNYFHRLIARLWLFVWALIRLTVSFWSVLRAGMTPLQTLGFPRLLTLNVYLLFDLRFLGLILNILATLLFTGCIALLLMMRGLLLNVRTYTRHFC